MQYVLIGVVIFGAFWLMNFVFAVFGTGTALCVSTWYFDRNDTTSTFFDLEHDKAFCRVFLILAKSFICHCGSC